ncbi:MAG: NAD-dependent epimerase/dehydratase family protein [Gemmatimonadota bacterium]
MAPATLVELELALSEPQPRAIESLERCPGDVVVLGAGGKMGPSLCRMLVRCSASAGHSRRVYAISRFTDPRVGRTLSESGVSVVEADLGNAAVYSRLPDAPNVFYLVGRKFGTTDRPGLTWYSNTVVPALAAQRYARSRIVAFSTGNVYPLVRSAGSVETDPLAPLGEYGASCAGRERVLEYLCEENGTPLVLLRLNYAVDLRYGVLVDIARKVFAGLPVDVGMARVNCIWQGDANAIAIASLTVTSVPAHVLNVTGTDVIDVRQAAEYFGAAFGRTPRFVGVARPEALLSDTTRMRSTVGEPLVDSAALMAWVARWVSLGLATGRETHFDQREGRF